VNARSPLAWLVSPDSTSMPPAFTSPRCLPPWKSRTITLAGTRSGAPAPVGRRAQALHVFIAVREPRLDPSPHRSRGRFVAACASTTSADRCFNEHDDGPLEHPGPRNPWPGWPPFDRSLPFDRRRPPKVLRVRGRGSPSLDLPSRDCSRKRLCPDPDRFRHLLSRALPVALSGVDEDDRRSRLRCGR
jgi:hypothetical protein